MVLDAPQPDTEGNGRRERDRAIGIYIGVLAVVLAICSMGGGNASKEATLKTIDAANTWAFFQAKNLRRHVLRTEIDELELWLAKEPDMPAAGRQAVEARMKAYRAQVETLTTDPKSGEGLDELWARGKALESSRDMALARDPYFDYGEGFLQIAIVLASVALISSGSLLLWVSGFLGFAGTLLTVNGFLLLVRVPGLG